MAPASDRIRRFLVVRDDFYPDPERVRRAAQSMEYHYDDEITGYMTTDVYHARGIRRRLERILNVRISRWDEDPEEGNGIFYGGFARGKHKEVPGVHSDDPPDDITVVIYLTPGLAANCGTSLWQHRRTGLVNAPNRSDARRLGMPLKTLRARLERDSCRRECWIELDRVGYRYNRMVAYSSGMLHSATRHFGKDLAEGRIYQTFRLGASWSTSGLYR